MPDSKFERVRQATNLGLSRFAKWLPILLRAALLLLFVWYGGELFYNASGIGATSFIIGFGGLFLVLLAAVMRFTYREYLKENENDDAESSGTMPFWPFLLINVLIILLVSAIAKWEQHRGSPGFTTGLLGFTQVWVHKIGGLFTGGR